MKKLIYFSVFMIGLLCKVYCQTTISAFCPNTCNTVDIITIEIDIFGCVDVTTNNPMSPYWMELDCIENEIIDHIQTIHGCWIKSNNILNLFRPIDLGRFVIIDTHVGLIYYDKITKGISVDSKNRFRSPFEIEICLNFEKWLIENKILELR